MQKPDTTPSKETTTPASAEKKTFIAPKFEKMDIALTESGAGTFDGADFSTYAS
ncbi:hypothetical protein IB234_21335 [Pseudomonas sp. PDM16]|uniref:hypothetical protein n=1 Tax=Pseudomonas sp. PDM16 TaxID=2769292 RepID=UPI001780AB05|nr:hypothetical protein [Pseudomonas sp. PDM16]MBD9417119.1 hypothetical protein [Pseudomonas sp. PDM16]